MKLIDYKFWYIRRNDNGFITDCAIRFYEGEITTKDEMDIDGKSKSITRYRRTKKLKKKDLPHFKYRFIKENNKTDAILFTQEDFGKIKTDDELRDFLNKELAKDKSREAISEQKWRA